MTLFSAAELECFRETQEITMQSICIIYPFLDWNVTEAGDVVGKTFGTPVTSICGITMAANRNSSTKQLENVDIIQADAVLRLPYGTVIKPKDEVEITHHYGSAADIVRRYEVSHYSIMGPSALRVVLRIKEF